MTIQRGLLVALLIAGVGAAASCRERAPRREQSGVATDELVPVGPSLPTPAPAPPPPRTVIDLSDDWTPAPFAIDASAPEDGAPRYRAILVALANESFGEGLAWERARSDRYFELYGVFPSFAVVRGRLLDEPRHACHDAVDGGGLEAFIVRPRGKPAAAAIRAAQAHLACDGLLETRFVDGRAGWRTEEALALYQRAHMLLAVGRLDADTAAAMLAGSRELDFLTLLRALRERVADAAGLIEDGSASSAGGRVLGRDLDAGEFRATDCWPALAGGAADAISPATEAAARALGWTSPAAATRWFAERPAGATRRLQVSVALPPPPAYHSAAMSLRAEIDRGAVPHRDDGRTADVRPSLVLYAATPSGDVPLVRWPTTIGGWQWELTSSGALVRRYKESPVGPRVWRQLVAAPAWLPPDTTPPRELVERRGSDWRLREETVGPGYASAYGLVMLVHERVDDGRRGPRLVDTAIRTHGSVNVSSILRGASHGCHRLFNHQALRLASFLLRHRPHVRRGPMPTAYARTVTWEGRTRRLERGERGYLWEFDPPVPVDVLRGR